MIKIKNKYKDAAISNSHHHEAEDSMDSVITSYINDEDVMMRKLFSPDCFNCREIFSNCRGAKNAGR